MLTIRHTDISELQDILAIYDIARQFMRENGNPTQWYEGYPKASVIEQDIADKNSYVCVENNRIVAVFSFIIGEEETYRQINGIWLNDNPYGTIHRLASSGEKKGIAKAVFDYCFRKINNIRVDTHSDNKPMLHCIKSHGFTYCGVIKVSDKTDRLAFGKLQATQP